MVAYDVHPLTRVGLSSPRGVDIIALYMVVQSAIFDFLHYPRYNNQRDKSGYWYLLLQAAGL